MADDATTRLYQAFVSQDAGAAIAAIERVKKGGTPQEQLFDTIFAPALSLLGGAWAMGSIDEITFTQASVVAEQITSFVAPPVTAQDTGVTVIIGSMHRDHHSMGKNIIAATLKEAGHRVVDMGVDVRPSDFMERLEETGARIVIVCADMVGTALDVSRVREMFSSAGHEEVLILVAGGPFSADPALAKSVGANGIIKGAESALKLVGRIAREKLGGG